MKIRQMDRSGSTARALARAGVTALGIGMTAALVLSGCAQSDVGGSEAGTSTTTTSPTPEESPSASDETTDDAAENGKSDEPEEAATMELEAGNSGRGLPPGLKGNTNSTVGVAWAPVEGLLYVVTNGSSSCPTYAEPEATLDDMLSVHLTPPSEGICTMDFVPTTTVVAAPAEADTGQEIQVVLGDKGEVTLPPRTAEGEPGPVAWLDS